MTGLGLVLGPVPDWHLDASCAEVDPALFYPQKGNTATRAKAICRGCSVREECLSEALRLEESERSWGVWGGLSERERRRLVVDVRRAA